MAVAVPPFCGAKVGAVRAGSAASAIPARGEAMVAIAASKAVIADRRINAEAIWVLRSKLFVPRHNETLRVR